MQINTLQNVKLIHVLVYNVYKYKTCVFVFIYIFKFFSLSTTWFCDLFGLKHNMCQKQHVFEGTIDRGSNSQHVLVWEW